jgi:hypothetical protein
MNIQKHLRIMGLFLLGMVALPALA